MLNWEAIRTSPQQLQQAVSDAGSISTLAEQLGMPRSSVAHWCSKHGVKGRPRGSRIPRGGALAATPPVASGHTRTFDVTVEPGVTEADLMRKHGLDPDEWEVASCHVQHAEAVGEGGEPVVLQRMRLTLKRRAQPLDLDITLPARIEPATRRRPRKRKPTAQRPLLIALAADQHCPRQDPQLEAHWLEWCADHKPDRIIGMGDLIDLSQPSRHRKNLDDRFENTPNECFAEGNRWWRDTLDAAGSQCQGEQLPGNHDLRVQIAARDRLPDCYDLKRPGEQHPWWDLAYLLGLDALGVTYHRPRGEYYDVEVPIARGLSASHGTKSGPYGGAAKDAIKHEGSRATGHAHKASITYITRYRDGEPHTHVNISVPAMCEIEQGYVKDAEVHQGWATIAVHQSGQWHAELARYCPRRKLTTWRDVLYAG